MELRELSERHYDLLLSFDDYKTLQAHIIQCYQIDKRAAPLNAVVLLKILQEGFDKATKRV